MYKQRVKLYLDYSSDFRDCSDFSDSNDSSDSSDSRDSAFSSVEASGVI